MRWKHARPFEPHEAVPDLSRQYVQGGTKNIEAPCLTCGEALVVLPEEVRRGCRCHEPGYDDSGGMAGHDIGCPEEVRNV